MIWIKICGFCDTESARVAVDLGVDAIGLNFVARSKRLVTADTARDIANALRGRVELVGVVEDMPLARAALMRDELRLDRIQFHGAIAGLEQFQFPDWAYLAVGIANARDAEGLQHCPGDRVLADTLIAGVSGGTGVSFDWSLVEGAARSGRIVMAGGLTPSNVEAAIRQVRPFGVDVASGVEIAQRPGYKDAELVRRFVQTARKADEQLRPRS